MKNDGKSIWLLLLEGLGELLLTLLCLVIGIFIVSLFGVNFESFDMDYDLIILLGFVSFFVVFGCINAFVQWLKKTIRRKHK